MGIVQVTGIERAGQKENFPWKAYHLILAMVKLRRDKLDGLANSRKSCRFVTIFEKTLLNLLLASQTRCPTRLLIQPLFDQDPQYRQIQDLIFSSPTGKKAKDPMKYFHLVAGTFQSQEQFTRRDQAQFVGLVPQIQTSLNSWD